MDVIISGRHVSVSEKIKDYVGAKIDAVLEGKPLKVSSARVILGLEKTRYSVEIIVRIKNSEFESIVESFDLFESIDAAAEKIEKQVKKYVDKAQDHHKRPSSKAISTADEDLEEIDAELAVYDE